ncbi:MAG: hypothetical protein L0Z62_16620 [Gemmataceae bacterium]|nr:hypothetical protein [Gemmataceae bacterium]
MPHAYQQCLPPASRRPDRRTRRQKADPHQHAAQDQEVDRHRQRVVEALLDLLAVQDRDDRSGQGGQGDEHAEGKQVFPGGRPGAFGILLTLEVLAQFLAQPLTIVEQHGDGGPEVQHAIEEQSLSFGAVLLAHAQKVLSQHQVAGAGDGQKLGDALQRPQEDCFQRRHPASVVRGACPQGLPADRLRLLCGRTAPRSRSRGG